MATNVGLLWRVTFTAKDIQVTDDEGGDRAEKYAREDAGQFRTSWDYEPPSVEPAAPGEEPAESDWDIELEVSQTDEDDDLFTFEATFSLVVMADDEDSAIAGARQIMELD